MLKSLSRSELEEFTEKLGFWLWELIGNINHFTNDCEADDKDIDLSCQLPSYCALKETTENAIDWLEGE
ncbi:UNVERIFIED_CONTAM: hypothetical protein BEN50_04875 [Euhalothece sp. KZN 001]